ncbi:hypothetical protein KY084_09045 [Stakelama sp. CBK3Z-3]|uniref:DUF4169 family protein n=1 Tax=Stakelama flava TaxID=2860338 RepID=A0ABS6XLD4_9SPHN|nr:hypothetical protein [Stakelama flava]MBW4331017.1 hypothetical protein [Stakelama flava]
MADKDEKQARLSEALRANLRRRKAQARELKSDQGAKTPPSDKSQSPDE